MGHKRPDILVSIWGLVYEQVESPAEQALAFLFRFNGERRIAGAKMNPEKLRESLRLALTLSDQIPDGPKKHRVIGLACYHGGITEGELLGNHVAAAVWHRRGAENDRLAGDLGGAAISDFSAAVSDLRQALATELGVDEARERLQRGYAHLQQTLRDTENAKRKYWRDHNAREWMVQLGVSIPT